MFRNFFQKKNKAKLPVSDQPLNDEVRQAVYRNLGIVDDTDTSRKSNIQRVGTSASFWNWATKNVSEKDLKDPKMWR